MTTTHDDNATTWRDLASQLTSDQIASLERAEQRYIANGMVYHPEAAAALIDFAHGYAETNVVDAQYADVEVPLGASTDSESWTRNLRTDGWSRSLEWRHFSHDGLDVHIDGRQECDGTFTREISVYGRDDEIKLTAEDARRMAALLIEAADELDRLQ